MPTRREVIKTAALAGFAATFCSRGLAHAQPALKLFGEAHSKQELARQILADNSLRDVYGMAQKLLSSGIEAGSNYQMTWIRDMNTFIEVALKVTPRQRFRDALLMFFRFQGANGDIPDLYRRVVDPHRVPVDPRFSPLAPGYVAAKNTVECDQESSLLQAVGKYVAATGDRTILQEEIGGVSVRERMGRALQYLLTVRFDPAHGLVWGATRADWGDVQPETAPGVRLNASSHRALCIYDNATFAVALNHYLDLIGDDPHAAAHWKQVREELRKNIHKHLWDAKNRKYIPHVYLSGSPFPKDFDENAIYYHGGTAVAIEADLLSRSEVGHALSHMEQDVRLAGASTIGLTLYPSYPEGFFKNHQMIMPYSYQNGGDWTWFGGRMIQQLVRYGYIAEAYRNMQPMVARVKRVGDFYEWWTRDDQPRGSAQFRGSAGALGRAIEMLSAWAQQEAS